MKRGQTEADFFVFLLCFSIEANVGLILSLLFFCSINKWSVVFVIVPQ